MPGGAARGGDHDHVGQFLADGVHHNTETLTILGGGAVVLADMDVENGRAGFIGALGFADHLFDGVGDSGVLGLCDLSAADGGGNDQLFHLDRSLLLDFLALAVLRRDAGAVGAAHDHRLVEHVGGGGADVGAGDDDLAGLKLHGA